MRGIFIIIILIFKRNKQVFIGLTQTYIAGPKEQAMRNSELEMKRDKDYH